MGRNPRFILPNSLQHVTDVTFQNRRFLRPSKEVNRLVLGIIGRAQKKYDMPICAVVAMSTHIHYLLRPRDVAHLAAFMCFVKTNIAKEIGRRLLGWTGNFFDGRYHLTPVSDEEVDQVGALRYILAHGVKECLVDSVKDWPGVHSALPTVRGDDMVGVWIDRTAEVNSGRRGDSTTQQNEFASEERVSISPLPCWQHMSEKQWRQAVSALVEEIDCKAAALRRNHGKSSLGVPKILAANPKERPAQVDKSPKPLFHARSPEVFRRMLSIWRDVIQRYREVSAKLRSGVQIVRFPEGTFPPGLPFVSFSLETVQTSAGSIH